MTLFGAFLLILAVPGAAFALGALARRANRPWALLEAVLLGGASRRGGVDLRFASFAAAVGVLLVGVVAALPLARSVRGGTLGFMLLLGLPALVGAMAVLGDLAGRGIGWWEERKKKKKKKNDHEHERDHEQEKRADGGMEKLLGEAQAELAQARALVQDPALLAALDALEEAALDYSRAAGDGEPGRLHEARSRVEGVVALARSCLDEERLSAARLLGVRHDASPAEVREVHAALRGIYAGTLRLAGIDPDHVHLLRRACDRLARVEPSGGAEARARLCEPTVAMPEAPRLGSRLGPAAGSTAA